MGALTWEFLERTGRGVGNNNGKHHISPETLGKIIAWSSCLFSQEGILHSEDMFAFLMEQDTLRDMPTSIAEAIHFDYQLDGIHIVESTRMMAAAQSSLAVGRLNPETLSPIHKISPLIANSLLTQLQGRHGKEVAWVKEQMAKKLQRNKPISCQC